MSDRDLDRRRLAAACGRYCAACDAFLAGRCGGCASRLDEAREGACPVLHCCIVDKGLEHCGLCADFACLLFLGHAGPLQVGRHYRALCRRTEMGTGAWLDEQEGRGTHLR